MMARAGIHVSGGIMGFFKDLSGLCGSFCDKSGMGRFIGNNVIDGKRLTISLV